MATGASCHARNTAIIIERIIAYFSSNKSSAFSDRPHENDAAQRLCLAIRSAYRAGEQCLVTMPISWRRIPVAHISGLKSRAAAELDMLRGAGV